MAEGAQKLIDFLQAVFHAEVKHITKNPNGLIMHASLLVGSSMLMLSDVQPPWSFTPAHLYVYLPNVDEIYAKAMKAGATSINSPTDQFYGDRMAGVKDPSGNTWWIATHIEDMDDAELNRRREKVFGGAKH